jgi:GntR family negative regulator for fad regulon and positive regulator of fabA
VARAAPELAAFLGAAETLAGPADYARFDWQLHHLLTVRSGNPIYTLILNGFRGFYEDIARRYFAAPEARRLSAQFYADLRAAARAADAAAAEALARAVMHRSMSTWSERAADTEEE